MTGEAKAVSGRRVRHIFHEIRAPFEVRRDLPVKDEILGAVRDMRDRDLGPGRVDAGLQLQRRMPLGAPARDIGTVQRDIAVIGRIDRRVVVLQEAVPAKDRALVAAAQLLREARRVEGREIIDDIRPEILDLCAADVIEIRRLQPVLARPCQLQTLVIPDREEHLVISVARRGHEAVDRRIPVADQRVMDLGKARAVTDPPPPLERGNVRRVLVDALVGFHCVCLGRSWWLKREFSRPRLRCRVAGNSVLPRHGSLSARR